MICWHKWEARSRKVIMKAFNFSPSPWHIWPVMSQAVRKPCFSNPIAKEIGAVNTIKFQNNILSGYNTDYLGFYKSIENLIKPNTKALILGTGGASKAVAYALKILKVKYVFVSRSKKNKDYINYSEINQEIIDNHKLVINCTPIGTYPLTEQIPQIPISLINDSSLKYFIK